ncbi:MAG: hypothetical protein NZM30_05610 [Geminocystis sp.]|nr:hypothetical protein [Geminocystis sp.]
MTIFSFLPVSNPITSSYKLLVLLYSVIGLISQWVYIFLVVYPQGKNQYYFLYPRGWLLATASV